MSNSPDSQVTERHYGVQDVVLRNAHGDVLHATQYALYPVDEPPLIEVKSIDRRWYRKVWEREGWEIDDV